MLKAAEFESVVIPDLMSDVFVLSSRPKIIAITLFPYIHSTIFLYNVHIRIFSYQKNRIIFTSSTFRNKKSR